MYLGIQLRITSIIHIWSRCVNAVEYFAGHINPNVLPSTDSEDAVSLMRKQLYATMGVGIFHLG